MLSVSRTSFCLHARGCSPGETLWEGVRAGRPVTADTVMIAGKRFPFHEVAAFGHWRYIPNRRYLPPGLGFAAGPAGGRRAGAAFEVMAGGKNRNMTKKRSGWC